MKKIHIVEDDKNIAELLEVLLMDQYSITFSTTIYEFWEKLKHSEPEAILLDINLPDGDGTELCKKLRSGKYAQLPIILMSAHLNLKQLDCGADDFIAKPFDIVEFRARIDKLIS